MKVLIKTAAVAVAAAGLSNLIPASANVSQTTEFTAGAQLASAPFGLSFEDLRVGPTGKVSAEAGSCELPVRVAEDVKCAVNTNCGPSCGKP